MSEDSLDVAHLAFNCGQYEWRCGRPLFALLSQVMEQKLVQPMGKLVNHRVGA